MGSGSWLRAQGWTIMLLTLACVLESMENTKVVLMKASVLDTSSGLHIRARECRTKQFFESETQTTRICCIRGTCVIVGPVLLW